MLGSTQNSLRPTGYHELVSGREEEEEQEEERRREREAEGAALTDGAPQGLAPVARLPWEPTSQLPL